MSQRRLPAASFVAIVFAVTCGACAVSDDSQSLSAVVRSTDTYRLQLGTGDEEGALVLEQARHSRVSEIRRDSSTNGMAQYVYQPAANFIGEDRVEIGMLSGSDGASAPTRWRRITIRFRVVE